jgi:hypothetical protein
MRWDLILERKSSNKLNHDIVRRHLREIAESAERNKAFGFTGTVGKLREPEKTAEGLTEQYRYLARLRLEKANARVEEAARAQFEHVLGVVRRCAESKGWSLLDNATAQPQEGLSVSAPVLEPRTQFVVPELTEEVKSLHFGGIYERDEHIRTIHEAVETMVETDGKVTNHQMLLGLWGSCKTVLMEKFKGWYEMGGKAERVRFVDGTTMSKAGLENWLLEQVDSDQAPDVLVVDELEKQPTENLSCLNGLMGSGILAKLNARIGNRRESLRMLVVGICNDLEGLKKHSLGNALLSRFGDPVYCTRPSRELSLKILTDMVAAFPAGKVEWAVKALEFGWDEMGQRDIRKMKKHLSGRDRLLTGEYQADQRKLLEGRKQEERALEEERANPV